MYQTVYGDGADKTADKIGVALLSATAVGIAAHAAIAAKKGAPKNDD